MRSQGKSEETVDFKIKQETLGILSPIEHISKLVIILFIPTLIFIMVNHEASQAEYSG